SGSLRRSPPGVRSRRGPTGAPFLPPASGLASLKAARPRIAPPAAAASPTQSISPATPAAWPRSRPSAGPNSSGSPTPAWGVEAGGPPPAPVLPARPFPALPAGSSSRPAGLAPTEPFQRVGRQNLSVFPFSVRFAPVRVRLGRGTIFKYKQPPQRIAPLAGGAGRWRSRGTAAPPVRRGGSPSRDEAAPA